MANRLEDIIINEIYMDDYIPQAPHMILEDIKYKYEEYADLDESVFWKAISRLEKNVDIAFTKKGKIARPSEVGLYKGTFSSSSKGNFGFVTTEQGEFFIPPKFTQGAVYSDTVAIRRFDKLSRYYGKGNEAEVVSIIERGLTTLIGTLAIYRNGRSTIAYLEPDNERIHLNISIPQKSLLGATSGDKVVVKIVKYPNSEFDTALGEVISCLGRADSLEANYTAILQENGIALSFSDGALNEAKEKEKEPIDISGRLDLRNEAIFTIDSYEAKDLDDAISVKKTENGYVLGVHIADVSHYVTHGSSLDKDAYERGTSVYFTDKVVPMLPKELSNGICSLNEGQDRLTLSAFMTLDRSGTILSTEIYNSVIKSKVKGIYSELNSIIENGKDSEFYQKYESVIDTFNDMLELYRILKLKSEQKGAMELESDETQIILDKNGHPVDVIKRERGESERLIEQFMLCANEGVASFMYNAQIPCVYRVHDEPDREKISSFAIFARNLGIDTKPLSTKNTITPSQLSLILKDSEKKGHLSIVSSVLLRSLMKARYSSLQKSHFGLNTEYYCHFTSPIRRYPDLSVHRILKAFLRGEISDQNIGAYEKFATLCAQMSSDNEVRAVHAERDIDELYKCIYMKDHIGEEIDCVICSVNSFGFFAKTDKLCQGLVSIESLGNGFSYDRENQILSRGRTVYRLGMQVKVLVSDVDISLRQVNFTLVRENNKNNENAKNEFSSFEKAKVVKQRKKSPSPSGKKRASYHNKRSRR